MKLPGIFLKITLLLLLVTGPAAAANPELQPLLDELKKAAATTENLSGNFVQEKQLAIFAATLTSQGRMVYQAPDRLRWELLEPVASGFVLNGEKGERWNGLSRERGRFSIDSDPVMGMIARQLLAWARVDMDWLEQRYEMALDSSQPLQLRLTPRDAGEATFINHLLIQFADDRRYVAEVLLVEEGGDSTRLRFSGVQVNGVLAADTFTPPEF